MKTSGSAFENFYQDELTTLAPVADRIFSTSVTTEYSVPLPANIPLSMKTVGDIAAKLNFPRISATVLKDTLEVFATDESPSVQATLYNTAQRVLTHCPAVQDIRYSLPNKHYIAVNLNAFKLDNGLGYEGGKSFSSSLPVQMLTFKQERRCSGPHLTPLVSSRPRLRARRRRSSNFVQSCKVYMSAVTLGHLLWRQNPGDSRSANAAQVNDLCIRQSSAQAPRMLLDKCGDLDGSEEDGTDGATDDRLTSAWAAAPLPPFAQPAHLAWWTVRRRAPLSMLTADYGPQLDLKAP